MLVRSSICGCIKLRTSIDEEPLSIEREIEFLDEIKEHHRFNRECWFKYNQNIVVRNIVKRGKED